MLGEKIKKLKARTSKLASDFAIRIEPDLDFLSRVRSASGEIRIVQGESGHVSYFSKGPRCYNNPQPGAVSINGKASYLNLVAALGRKNVKGYSLETRIEDNTLLSQDEGKGWEVKADVSGLGEVKREIIIPAV
jgi:hypothetical protein